jgi:predicted PurR-regulated permease PerM
MNLTKWILYSLIIVLVVCGLMFYSWIFKYLAWAVVFSYIFNPTVNWLERHRIPRLVGILLVYSFVGTILTLSIIRLLPVLVEQAQSLFNFIKTTSQQGEISLLKIPFVQTLLLRIDYLDVQVPILKLHTHFVSLVQSLNNSMMNIPQVLISNYQKIFQAVSIFATIPFIGFFLLKDNVKFRKDVFKLIPNKYFEIVLIAAHKVDEIVGKYLRAMLIEIIIVGTLSSVALSFLGVNYAILIGFMAGFANVIPYFGPILGVMFAIISILLGGNPPVMILYVIVTMYLIHAIDNNFVYPFVVGATIEMHPLIVLLTVLAGGWAWGLIGMLVSVPVVYLVYGVTRVLFTNLKEFKMI